MKKNSMREKKDLDKSLYEYIEKDINLKISLKLKEVLEGKGYKVYLTRESDEALGNSGSTIKEKKREDLKKRRDMKKRREEENR